MSFKIVRKFDVNANIGTSIELLRGSLLLTFMLLAAVVTCCTSGCGKQPQTGEIKNPKSQPSRNIWAAREVDDEEVDAVKTAWLRYAKSQGMTESDFNETRSGFSQEQIAKLEEGICTRLPRDLKAFLSFNPTANSFIGDRFRLHATPERIIALWKQKVEMQLLIIPRLKSVLPTPLRFEPDQWEKDTQFNAYLIPLCEENDTNEIFVDIRNGQVMKSVEYRIQKQADSITDFVNAIAAEEEQRNVKLNQEAEE